MANNTLTTRPYHRCPACDQAVVVCTGAHEIAVETCAWPPAQGYRVTLNGDNTTYRAERCWGGYAHHCCTRTPR